MLSDPLRKKNFDIEFDEKILNLSKFQSSKTEEENFISQLLLTPKIIKNVMEKFKVKQPSYQESLTERLYGEAKVINMKKNEMRDNFEINQQKQCTFKPKVIILKKILNRLFLG